MIEKFAVLEGPDLRDFLQGINDSGHVYRLRIAVDGGLKVKINEGTWSPALGAEEGAK